MSYRVVQKIYGVRKLIEDAPKKNGDPHGHDFIHADVVASLAGEDLSRNHQCGCVYIYDTELCRVRGFRKVELPAVAFPGGYTITYFDLKVGEAYCSDCATKIALDVGTAKQFTPDIHYEGPPLTCGKCDEKIPSEYGDPDASDDENAEE